MCLVYSLADMVVSCSQTLPFWWESGYVRLRTWSLWRWFLVPRAQQAMIIIMSRLMTFSQELSSVCFSVCLTRMHQNAPECTRIHLRTPKTTKISWGSIAPVCGYVSRPYLSIPAHAYTGFSAEVSGTKLDLEWRAAGRPCSLLQLISLSPTPLPDKSYLQPCSTF